MQIQIDTNDLSDQDRKILALLAGNLETVSESARKASTPAPQAKAKAAKAPKVEPKKSKAEPEEPEEPEESEESEESDESEESEDDAPTVDDAIALATEMVSNGKAKRVKAVLSELGVDRVSKLKGEQVAAFIEGVK
jgi:hypothetical protein